MDIYSKQSNIDRFGSINDSRKLSLHSFRLARRYKPEKPLKLSKPDKRRRPYIPSSLIPQNSRCLPTIKGGLIPFNGRRYTGLTALNRIREDQGRAYGLKGLDGAPGIISWALTAICKVALARAAALIQDTYNTYMASLEAAAVVDASSKLFHARSGAL